MQFSEDDDQISQQSNEYHTPNLRSGRKGRPKKGITSDQIMHLKNIGFTWTSMCKALHISRSTLYRYKHSLHIETPYVNDEELNSNIRDILSQTPDAGEVYVIGGLRARNLHVSRLRVREQINNIDPRGRALRKTKALHRRIYNVKGANFLWHMDSNHKLVNFRFVFHGCIDGYSRTIIYLKCLSDNTASSVLSLFENGVRNFGIPSRVRGDRGTENIDVARFMIQARGLDRGSFIVGRSVHNQRIERLWAEVNRVVTRRFKSIFLYLEQENLLDENCELDLFCLSFIYLPRIQKALNEFIGQWNYHGLSTMNSRSPLQIWNMATLEGKNYTVNEDPVYFENPEQYGVEDFGDYFPAIETENNVIVPQSEIILTQEQINELNDAISNVPLDDDNGIIHYLVVRQMIKTMS